MKEKYQDATAVLYGHLFIDLTQKSVMSQKYCSNKKDNNHNIFHLSKLGGDLELQNTHLVFLKSPKDISKH